MNPTVTLDIDLMNVFPIEPGNPMTVIVMPTGRVTVYVVQEDTTGVVVTSFVPGRGVEDITITSRKAWGLG